MGKSDGIADDLRTVVHSPGWRASPLYFFFELVAKEKKKQPHAPIQTNNPLRPVRHVRKLCFSRSYVDLLLVLLFLLLLLLFVLGLLIPLREDQSPPQARLNEGS